MPSEPPSDLYQEAMEHLRMTARDREPPLFYWNDAASALWLTGHHLSGGWDEDERRRKAKEPPLPPPPWPRAPEVEAFLAWLLAGHADRVGEGFAVRKPLPRPPDEIERFLARQPHRPASRSGLPWARIGHRDRLEADILTLIVAYEQKYGAEVSRLSLNRLRLPGTSRTKPLRVVINLAPPPLPDPPEA